MARSLLAAAAAAAASPVMNAERSMRCWTFARKASQSVRLRRFQSRMLSAFARLAASIGCHNLEAPTLAAHVLEQIIELIEMISPHQPKINGVTQGSPKSINLCSIGPATLTGVPLKLWSTLCAFRAHVRRWNIRRALLILDCMCTCMRLVHILGEDVAPVIRQTQRDALQLTLASITIPISPHEIRHQALPFSVTWHDEAWHGMVWQRSVKAHQWP